MSADALRDKWDRIYRQPQSSNPLPAEVLSENAHLLPATGTALDLACGLGGNALFLAQRGLCVSAIDISPVAIKSLSAQAKHLGLTIAGQALDAETEPLPRQAFDVIVVSRFLSRPLAASIQDSLKSGGLLFYQTYLRDKLNLQGPSNPDYLLAENELLSLFNGMRVLVYHEEGRVGNLSLGRRDEAYFVGQKR